MVDNIGGFSNITVTLDTAATGGVDAETTESISFNNNELSSQKVINIALPPQLLEGILMVMGTLQENHFLDDRIALLQMNLNYTY